LTYFDRLGKKFTDDESNGIYFLAIFILVFELLVLQSIVFIEVGWSSWSYAPLLLITESVLIFFAIWSIKKFKSQYLKTIGILRKNKIISKKNVFSTIIPKKWRLVFLIIAEVGIFFRILIYDIIPVLQYPSIIGNNIGVMTIFNPGLIHAVFIIIYWSLFLIPLSAEFVSMFIGIHVYFPYLFQKSKLHLKLSDPHLFFGLRPIGRLFVHSALIYYIGLTLVLIYVWSSHWEFGLGTISFFIGGWILGFVLFFTSQVVIHNRMKQAKQKKLEEIERKIQKEGKDRKSLLETEPKDIVDSAKYIHRYVQYNHADKLRVYPFDMTTIRDLMMVAIIPVSAEVVIRLYFHFTGL
jgi:hypothetical protein